MNLLGYKGGGWTELFPVRRHVYGACKCPRRQWANILLLDIRREIFLITWIHTCLVYTLENVRAIRRYRMSVSEPSDILARSCEGTSVNLNSVCQVLRISRKRHETFLSYRSILLPNLRGWRHFCFATVNVRRFYPSPNLFPYEYLSMSISRV